MYFIIICVISSTSPKKCKLNIAKYSEALHLLTDFKKKNWGSVNLTSKELGDLLAS